MAPQDPAPALTSAEARALGRRHPLYRAIRAAWWVLAIWVAGAVLVGIIRGTFGPGPAPTLAPQAPLTKGAPSAPTPTTPR